MATVKKKKSTAIFCPEVGERVLISKRHYGVVKFVGGTAFAEGTWIGVELEECKGKNNGAVNGKQYFQCKDNHGIFVKPSMVDQLPKDDANLPAGSASSGATAAPSKSPTSPEPNKQRRQSRRPNRSVSVAKTPSMDVDAPQKMEKMLQDMDARMKELERQVASQQCQIRRLQERIDDSGPGPRSYEDAAEILAEIYYRVITRDLETF